MTDLATIPFVDLAAQHRDLQAEFETAFHDLLHDGDFIVGRAVREFEAAFAAACGTKFGVGVACGTDAIALGLQACGIGAGDEVLVPANTFVATIIGIIRAGAIPVMVDCDPATALIDLEAAEAAITPRTRAIVPVHLYGQMVSPQRLLALAERFRLLVFEDAAQAHRAEREGYRAGSVGLAAAFSFYPSKNLGAMGDGGMVVTRDEGVAQRLRSLRNYGAPRKYYHDELGTNSRLDTIQAAILGRKLPHLDRWNAQRNQAAATYDRLLEPLRDRGVVPMENQCGPGHVYHLYVLRVGSDSPVDRNRLQAALGERQIQTGIHYPIPCHLQPAFSSLGYAAGTFPQSEALCEQILSLPMYPGLPEAWVERTVAAIAEIVEAAAAEPEPQTLPS